MEPIKIEATVDTPGIIFDPQNNHFELQGKSYPEDTREFYGPILEWMDRYVKAPNPETTLIIKLKYFNSSSYKPLFDILTKLETIKDQKVSIQWHYKFGDTDMKESGEEFADMVDLDFSFHTF
jgi:hypothetical protein